MEFLVLVCHWGAPASGQPPGRLSLGHRHVSLRRLSEVCPSWLQVAWFALGIWYIISFTLRIWQSRSLCVGVACGVQHLIFREILQLLEQLLVRQWIHVLHQYFALLDELNSFSTLRQTRILKCCSPFCRRTEKRAQSMLLVAVLLRAVHLEKLDTTFTSFT